MNTEVNVIAGAISSIILRIATKQVFPDFWEKMGDDAKQLIAILVTGLFGFIVCFLYGGNLQDCARGAIQSIIAGILTHAGTSKITG